MRFNMGVTTCRRPPVLLLVIGIVALMAGIGLPASAQTPEWRTGPTPTAKPPKPKTMSWLVNCQNTGEGGTLDCKMSQTIIMKKTSQRILTIVIRKGENEKNPSMMLSLPHGLFLPAGVNLSVDGKQIRKLPVQTCDKAGCYAGLPVSPELLEAMRKGNQISVSLQDLKKRKIKVSATLAGFTSAYNQMK